MFKRTLLSYKYFTTRFLGDGDWEEIYKLVIAESWFWGWRVNIKSINYTASMFQNTFELHEHWDKLIKDKTHLK